MTHARPIGQLALFQHRFHSSSSHRHEKTLHETKFAACNQQFRNRFSESLSLIPNPRQVTMAKRATDPRQIFTLGSESAHCEPRSQREGSNNEARRGEARTPTHSVDLEQQIQAKILTPFARLTTARSRAQCRRIRQAVLVRPRTAGLCA